MIHFFLECCLYVEAREPLRNNLKFLEGLIIETEIWGAKFTIIQISAAVHETNETFYSIVKTLHILKLAISFCAIFSHYYLFFHEYDIFVLLCKDILNSICYIISKILFFLIVCYTSVIIINTLLLADA
jgi:hypothetical protein